ncbi:hypothetical protein [Algoriphagus boritolerans]|uniref:hypothetical protein n=1 Tax=Algoriphagus boritolerans TaxID=308111 RepID=UPI001359C302|nr:hypothetical protein [Algoriphagus boritolerans]
MELLPAAVRDSGRVEFELSFASNAAFEKPGGDWYQSAIISNRIIFRKDQPNSKAL